MWLQPSNEPRPKLTSNRAWFAAIAIPARNEAARIERCLKALDEAAGRVPRSSVTAVVLVNNSSDRTRDLARRFEARHLQLVVKEQRLPPRRAHAGGARRAACEAALDLLPANGVLLTTDADSRVHPDWLLANLHEFECGAEAVAGTVALDPDEPTPLLRPERAVEWRLAQAHAELAALLDPVPHDPWPTHRWSWGASLALTVAAYRKARGMPNVPLCEDRHLARALEGYDVKLRHSHLPLVYTSGRQDGRADGGFAALVAAYAKGTPVPCDALLEPLAVFAPKLRARATARAMWPDPERLVPFIKSFGIAFPHLGASFGGWWHVIEARVPGWTGARVQVADLPHELAAAEALLAELRPALTSAA